VFEKGTAIEQIHSGLGMQNRPGVRTSTPVALRRVPGL
jgi:hypothetical protein